MPCPVPADPVCTILICTRDRLASLATTLDTLCRMDAVAAPWELLLVNNGAPGSLDALAARYAAQLPLRLVEAPEPGLSNARNVGVGAARGTYLVWTDDDTRVAPTFLVAYLAGFAAFPAAVLFAGRITPVLTDPPRWFAAAASDLHFLLAARDFGTEPIPLDSARDVLPFGASFAIRADVQRAHLYDPDLGVAPGRRRGGEETAVARAVLAAGHTGWYLPSAAVDHIIPPTRQTRSYVVHFYEAMGEAWAHGFLRTAVRPGAPKRIWLKTMFALARLALLGALRPARRTRYLASLAFNNGALQYLLNAVPAD